MCQRDAVSTSAHQCLKVIKLNALDRDEQFKFHFAFAPIEISQLNGRITYSIHPIELLYFSKPKGLLNFNCKVAFSDQESCGISYLDIIVFQSCSKRFEKTQVNRILARDIYPLKKEK